MNASSAWLDKRLKWHYALLEKAIVAHIIKEEAIVSVCQKFKKFLFYCDSCQCPDKKLALLTGRAAALRELEPAVMLLLSLFLAGPRARISSVLVTVHAGPVSMYKVWATDK